ncbi:TonB-dependent receptor [Lysobacter brunescens]|uniref:TonB-dependent receptor n=1 Tax=Lysobacter brunescens TaxID=262323 RepID=A0ABW2YDC3_9GAMM
MPAHLAKTALAVAVLLALSTAAQAETLSDAAGDAGLDAQTIDKVEVHGMRPKAQSPKYTESLQDTPQTITVVTKDVMAQQNLLGLRDVLSTLPGITFGAGEGGGGFGDSINLRGFTANSDITVDGVRDSAQYSRSDNFNLEAIELVNGANSVMSGAGSVGGTINLSSKVAREGDAHAFTLGAGTDSYVRGTADSNFDFENGTALRLNAMVHQNDVPGRDHEEAKRWGFAPSIAFGLGTDTRFTLSHVHQQDDNTPTYGVPYYRNAFNDGPLPGVDPSTYFGFHNFDTQEITSDTTTAIFEHDFNEKFSIRNLTRWSEVEQLIRVTPPQGTWCLGNGTLVTTGAACATPGFFTQGGPAGNTRDTRNTILYTQTDATLNFSTGSVEHDLVAGFSIMHESFDLATGNSLRNPNGTTPTFPVRSIYNPDTRWTGPVNFIVTGKTKGDLDNRSLYVFDTIKFNPKWWLSLSARYERNEGDTSSITIATPAAGGAITYNPTFENADNLFSYRAGLVFKPVEHGTIYFAYSNSKTPSKASVNGSCTAQTCAVDPETAVNVELGTKWDLLDSRLALTAALFRNERQNYKVADPGNPNNPTGEQQLDGKARVDGIALGVAGNITDAWSVFANYTYLDSEVLQSVSDFVRQTTGVDAQAGNPLTNTPKHSASAWTTYRLNDWTIGYGATYQGDFYLNNSGAVLYKAPSYWMHRAMVGYRINDAFALQLNVNNLFDKEYYTRIRNNGWATPGDARSATLTATYRF